MTTIARLMIAALIAALAFVAVPSTAHAEEPACDEADIVCDYWQDQADYWQHQADYWQTWAASARERIAGAEAQLTSAASELASLRFQVAGLRDDLANAHRAEQRQRRVAERYFLRLVKLQAQVVLLRAKLGLPARHNRNR